MKRHLAPVTIGLFALLAFGSLSGCTTDSSIKQQIVTAENSKQLAQQAKQDLSFEDYELMRGYVARVHPDIGEGDLPVGMPVGTMIESQRAFQAANPGSAEVSQSEAMAATAAPAPAETLAPPGSVPAAQPAPSRPASVTPSNSGPSAAPAESTASTAPQTETTEPPAQAEPAAVEPAPQEPAKPARATLEEGTELVIRLAQSLSSKTNQAGQSFEAILEEDLRGGGHLLAPAGSKVLGRITEAQASGKVKGRARMSLTLNRLVFGDDEFDLATNTLNFEAQGSEKQDAKRIGIASGIGAVVGAIAGGGKGAAIGAVIGAGAGTGVTLATPGDEVEFPTEQRMSFKLRRDAELPIRR